MPELGEHDPRVCDAAFGHAFEILGKRWNGMILATLTSGPAGFGELRRAVAGISDSVLSDRLAELARADLIARTVCPGPPVAVVYALTPRGHGLVPALDELRRWADSFLDRERAAAE